MDETCLSIYSRCVNAEVPIEQVLSTSFPWCSSWATELKRLFAAYVEAKQGQNVLDYDDLLLHWDNDEKASRKRRLIKGPEEFREDHVDLPKAKGK